MLKLKLVSDTFEIPGPKSSSRETMKVFSFFFLFFDQFLSRSHDTFMA